MRRILPPLIPFFVLLALGEGIVRGGWIPHYLLPAPSEVVRALVTEFPYFVLAFFQTGLASLCGFSLSVTVGMSVAIVLSRYPFLLRAFYPYALFFQTVPIIAIAPILVIWFGYGMPAVVAASFIVSVFPVIANTLSGLQATDPALLELFQLYGATAGQKMWKLRVPFALPQILTGFQVAAGLAVIGAIVGEFIGGGGLGSVVDVARAQQRVDQVFAAVGLASGLGLLFYLAIHFLTAYLLRHWHPQGQRVGKKSA